MLLQPLVFPKLSDTFFMKPLCEKAMECEKQRNKVNINNFRILAYLINFKKCSSK